MVFYMLLTLIEIRATYIVIDNKNPYLVNAIRLVFLFQANVDTHRNRKPFWFYIISPTKIHCLHAATSIPLYFYAGKYRPGGGEDNKPYFIMGQAMFCKALIWS